MSDDIETKAKSMGWIPKEEFKGDPEKWKDAEAYVETGETVLPILRHSNETLRKEVGELRSQLDSTKKMLGDATEAINALKEFNSETNRKAMKESKAQLLAGIKAAKTSGDIDAEMELTDQLTEVNATLKESEEEETKEEPRNGTVQPKADPAAQAVFDTWKASNPWYGTDLRKTGIAHGVANWLRSDPQFNGLRNETFLAKVAEEVEKIVNPPQGAVERVSSSRQSSSSSSDGKSFADLPADAKAACKRQGTKLIGPGKAFKDEASWNKHYADVYFNS